MERSNCVLGRGSMTQSAASVLISGIVVAGVASQVLHAVQPRASPKAVIAISATADMVSGGELLVRVTGVQSARDVKVALNGRDVLIAFRPEGGNALVGLISALINGVNTVTVTEGGTTASLTV